MDMVKVSKKQRKKQGQSHVDPFESTEAIENPMWILKETSKVKEMTPTKANQSSRASGLTDLEKHLKAIFFGENLTKKEV